MFLVDGTVAVLKRAGIFSGGTRRLRFPNVGSQYCTVPFHSSFAFKFIDPAQWSRSELLEYLEHHQLQFLKPLYDPNNPIFNTLATEETRMFARSDREPSFVYLQAATLTKLLDLLVLPLDGSRSVLDPLLRQIITFSAA